MKRVITRRPNLAVLCGLARNPATPLPLLARLATHPHNGLLSPAAALLGRDDFPPEVARTLATHPDTEVRRALAAHPSTPQEIRRALADDTEPAVRAAVAGWPQDSVFDSSKTVPTPLPDEVYLALATDPDPSVRTELGKNHRMPQSAREVLAGDADREVRRCAALDVLPTAVLHRLLGDPDSGVRQTALMTAAVHTPASTIPEELAVLFEDDPSYYRQQAAELVELTPQVLQRRWAHQDQHAALARNPSLPVEKMRELLNNADVHAALAGNPSLPADLMDHLAATEDRVVCQQLLRREDLPDRLRRRLIATIEADQPVARGASLLPYDAGLGERLSYLDHPNPAFRRILAGSPDLPQDVVHRLARDPDFATRLLLCECHSDVPAEVLVEVLEGWNGRSRAQLLCHPSLPAEAVHRYATGDNARDREAIAARADLPHEVALALVDDQEAEVRSAIAANPALPHDLIRRLLADPSPSVRESAAANPALPAEELERLFDDSRGDLPEGA